MAFPIIEHSTPPALIDATDTEQLRKNLVMMELDCAGRLDQAPSTAPRKMPGDRRQIDKPVETVAFCRFLSLSVAQEPKDDS
jgi:hypothetical protein